MERVMAFSLRYQKWFFLAPVLVLLIGFFVIPLIWLFRVSFFLNEGASGFGVSSVRYYVPDTFTLNNYKRFFTDTYFLNIMYVTLKIGFLTTVTTMLLSYPFAYYIYRARPLVKGILLTSVVIPKLINMLVLFYGLQILIGTNGILNQFLMKLGIIDTPLSMVHNYFSVVMGKTLLILPYTVLVITAALHGIDKTLVDAAQGLGASKFRAFWEVTFPLSLPGTMVGLLITIIWALGAFVSPYLLGNPDLYTLAVEVQRQTFENVNWAMGSAVAFVMLFMIMILVFFYNWFEKKFEKKRESIA
jgi:putative spermidine/putrescine transport system permease protein